MSSPTPTAIPGARPTQVASLQELDELLGWIRVRNNMRISITAAADAAVAEIVSRRINETAQLDAEIEAATATAMAWLQAERPRFDKKRSIKLAHGTVGFRKSKEKVVFDLEEEAVIRNLRALSHGDCVELVSVVRKDAVKTLDEDTLSRVGIHLEAAEIAYIDIVKDKTPTYGADA